MLQGGGRALAAPGRGRSAFFNYGHTMRSWKEYCKQVEQYRLQFTLQKKVGGLLSLSSTEFVLCTPFIACLRSQMYPFSWV